jgi:predicted lipoprotein with Yx(FWY)xxD motif
MKLRTLSAIVLGLVLAACGTEGEGDTTTTAAEATTTTVAAGQEDPVTTTTEAMTTTSETMEETATSSAEAMEGVHVADTDLGSILVGPEGFTLYLFTNDSEGESTCYDSCADLWPPVPANTPIGSDLDESMFSSVTRDDGTEQLAVNGMPLYLYTPDENPGDTTGQGFNGVWFVLDAEGNMIEASASEQADEPEDEAFDYDY